MIDARNIRFRRGKRVILDDVTLQLAAGEVVALLGPNGSGKTTLLRILSGELAPDSGVLQLDGKALASYSARELARRRAVLSQAIGLAFPFTALEVVLMGRHPLLGPAGETPHDVEAAFAALARADAMLFADQQHTTLSGGEQQRVNLARSLAQETPTLLLDEPTTHLDPKHQHAILAVARALAANGCAVLAVLHDLNLAAMYADRVGVLVAGRLVALGRPWDVLTPERLQAAFGVPFATARHPVLDRPLLVPLPKEPVCTWLFFTV